MCVCSDCVMFGFKIKLLNIKKHIEDDLVDDTTVLMVLGRDV